MAIESVLRGLAFTCLQSEDSSRMCLLTLSPPLALLHSRCYNVSFPDLKVAPYDTQHGGNVASTLSNNTNVMTHGDESGATSTESAAIAALQESVNAVTAAFSNINVAVFDIFACFVGARHGKQLVYTTTTVLGIMIVASILPWVLSHAIRRKNVTHHDSNTIAAFKGFALKGQLLLVFLLYPALTTTIMRTFVCKEYAQDNTGNPTLWLVDDTTVHCDTSPLVGTGGVETIRPYTFLYAYGLCMVVMIVIGFPAFLFYRLW